MTTEEECKSLAFKIGDYISKGEHSMVYDMYGTGICETILPKYRLLYREGYMPNDKHMDEMQLLAKLSKYNLTPKTFVL